MDRGYNDCEWFRELTQEEVQFVTRMKEKAVYEVQEELEIPQNSNVVMYPIISFPPPARAGEHDDPQQLGITWQAAVGQQETGRIKRH
jgi:hypothetical protein